MLEILVLRHGQSVADIEGRYEGRADFPLTGLGREQAHHAARWIAANCPPTAIVASPLVRASETALIVGAACGLPVRFDEALMELNNGVLAGLLYEEADRLYPLPEGGRLPHERVPGGESLLEFRFRAEEVWSRLVSDYADAGRLLVVAHGGYDKHAVPGVRAAAGGYRGVAAYRGHGHAPVEGGRGGTQHPVRQSPGAPGRARRDGYSSGTVNQNVLPTPCGPSSTPMWPPCASTASREM